MSLALHQIAKLSLVDTGIVESKSMRILPILMHELRTKSSSSSSGSALKRVGEAHVKSMQSTTSMR
eukprot:2322395-Rhodomonas_salina.1